MIQSSCLADVAGSSSPSFTGTLLRTILRFHAFVGSSSSPETQKSSRRRRSGAWRAQGLTHTLRPSRTRFAAEANRRWRRAVAELAQGVADHIRKEAAKWAEVIRTANIQLD